MSFVTTGKVAFSNILEHDVYKGKSTGRYSIVITMDEAEAEKLEQMGVRLKDYEGTAQRKFTTQYKVDVIDLDGNPVPGELPRGSEIRVLWKAGEDGENGVPAYLQKIRVVSLAEYSDDEVPDEF